MIVLRLFAIAALLQIASGALAYGPLGHEIVGAIADRNLAGTATGAKVSELLDGMSLRAAANLADEIKSWDKNGADDPRGFHLRAHPAIDEQLREFWKANPPTHEENAPAPSHHWFHYTDVPVFDAEKYADGKIGRGNWDIVHAIPLCIGVLRGEIPPHNPRKITRPVALILLAHLIGDIHQPLHVGAEYFNNNGQPVDPDRAGPALGDEGGNSLSFVENATARHARHYYHSFHAYWDLDLPRNLVIGTPDELPKEVRDAAYAEKENLMAKLSASEPKQWSSFGDPSRWAEQWANDILPIAREAHARVRFSHVHGEEKEGRVFAQGEAIEIGSGYREWATGVVLQELHRAGWRLAHLLKTILQPW